MLANEATWLTLLIDPNSLYLITNDFSFFLRNKHSHICITRFRANMLLSVSKLILFFKLFVLCYLTHSVLSISKQILIPHETFISQNLTISHVKCILFLLTHWDILSWITHRQNKYNITLIRQLCKEILDKCMFLVRSYGLDIIRYYWISTLVDF